MKKERWSEYAKYLVLADNSNEKLLANFSSYLNFLKVKDIVDNMAFSDKSTYSFDGNIYSRKITSSEAKGILDNIEQCRWTNTTSKMLLVANQLKLRI